MLQKSKKDNIYTQKNMVFDHKNADRISTKRF